MSNTWDHCVSYAKEFGGLPEDYYELHAWIDRGNHALSDHAEGVTEGITFDDCKIEEFINRWYHNRIPDKAEARRRSDQLSKAILANDRIKLLARNPPVLTIIALIHRYQALLPKERYKLYDKAVEMLITNWDKNKELSNHEVLEYLGLDDLRRLMESLAYWIHGKGGTGDPESGTLIDRGELTDN